MPTDLPKPPPEMVHNMDQFCAACYDLLDHYIGGFNVDLNRHAVKHGPMSDAEAVFHLTKILVQHVDANMLAGMCAAAIVRGIAGKARGKG